MGLRPMAAPAPRPRRPAGQRLSLHLGEPGSAGGAHLVPRGRAAPGAGALCPPSGSRWGRASRRPLRCRPRRRQALQGGAAKLRRARCTIFPRRCHALRRPALQPRAGTYTWHRSRQSQWSSAGTARRSALRCATPPRPFRKLSSAENFGFTDPTNRDHPLSRRHETPNLDWNEFRNAEP
jgi:hypothetical protein